ncbi:MAG: cobalt-precorrin 5A hydrolase [Halobacteriota archaeon]
MLAKDVKITIICFKRNRDRAQQIQSAIGGKVVVYHKNAFDEAFSNRSAIVALMATGVVAREIAPLLNDKWLDPPVVVVDDGCRYAIPITGGHHGANAIASELFKRGVVQLPAITTATEANGVPNVENLAQKLGCNVMNQESSRHVNTSFLCDPVDVLQLTGPKVVIVEDDVSVLSRTRGLNLVIGIGARKSIDKQVVLAAIEAGLTEAQSSIENVRVIATAYLKTSERGIIDAAFDLGKPVAFVPKQIINDTKNTSKSRSEMLGLVGVAEPCALALSNLKELVLAKRIYGGVTLAIAR